MEDAKDVDDTSNRMAVITKVTSKITLRTAMANISTGRAIDTKASGKTTCPMAKEKPYILTKAGTMESF